MFGWNDKKLFHVYELFMNQKREKEMVNGRSNCLPGIVHTYVNADSMAYFVLKTYAE